MTAARRPSPLMTSPLRLVAALLAVLLSAASVAAPAGASAPSGAPDAFLYTVQPGDKLIVEGLLNLRPGATVKPAAPQQVAKPAGGAPGAATLAAASSASSR